MRLPEPANARVPPAVPLADHSPDAPRTPSKAPSPQRDPTTWVFDDFALI